MTSHRSDIAVRLSVEEWGALPEDTPGEWVDGRLVEEEEVGYVHEIVVLWLGAVLRAWVVPRGGRVGGSDARFVLGPGRGRKPDLSMYFAGRKPPGHGAITLPPDIVIEVVSPSPRDVRRDRITKLNEYAAFGVAFYWILDPQARTLEIYRREQSGLYARVLSAEGGLIERVPGCDGLRLDLDSLWREVNELSPEEEPVPEEPPVETED